MEIIKHERGKGTVVFNSLLFILFLLSGADAFCLEVDQAYPVVTRVEVKGLLSLPQKDLLDLLDIRPGKRLDPTEIRAGIKRAFLTGIFDDIAVEKVQAVSPTVLIVVKEKSIIDSIRIKGNDHFSGGFIRKQLQFHNGERLNDLKVRNSLLDLKNEMAKRGFPHAEATASVVPLNISEVSVVITVNEESPELIKKIEITDSDNVAVRYLNLSVGDIFDRVRMDQFTRKVMQHYKELEYIETSVSFSYDDGILSIKVEKGKQLKILFSGNTSFSSKDLMKEIPFFEINEFSDDLLEETTARLVALFHRFGYPYAQIVPVQTAEGDVREITFFVFEGERYHVNSIKFEGVTISPERLRDIISFRAGEYYDADSLEPDIDTLAEFYHSLGYINVEVEEPDVKMTANVVDLTYRIKEGQQIKINKIAIAGNSSIPPDLLKDVIQVKTGQPYNEVDISDTRRKILELYNKYGFVDAKVVVDREISDGQANVSFTINEGNITVFGKTIIIGNEQTKQHIITREFLHSEGTPLDYSLLLKERQELYRLGLFTDVEAIPGEKWDSKRDIIYKVKEANAGAVEFGVGYGEYEKYRGFFDISYRNLWGMNRQVSFRTELSSLEKRFILSYNQPWFFVRDFTLKAALLQEDRKERNIDTGEISYRLLRRTATVGVSKKLSDTIKAELNYDFSVVKTSDVQPDVILTKEDTGSLIISGVRPELIFDTRDNPFEPKRGVLAGLSFKVASSLLFSQTDFTKLSAYINKYQSLGRRTVLAGTLKAGAAKGFSDTRELPLVERFFLGGRTTVRGYDQDTLGPKGSIGTPTGGNAFLMGSVELRNDVGKGVGVVTFLDGGNVWQKVEQASLLDLKYTTGLGLRYTTPVGPVRVDYGYKLNRETGESKGALHFSLGHAF